MGRPERGPSEMQVAYQNHLKNYKPPSPEKPYYQQDYWDVVDFLNEKILNYIRLNPRLRNNIYNRKRFMENKADGIYINLIEFNEGYRARFILPDFEGYCLKFIELLKPLLQVLKSALVIAVLSFDSVWKEKHWRKRWVFMPIKKRKGKW